MSIYPKSELTVSEQEATGRAVDLDAHNVIFDKQIFMCLLLSLSLILKSEQIIVNGVQDHPYKNATYTKRKCLQKKGFQFQDEMGVFYVLYIDLIELSTFNITLTLTQGWIVLGGSICVYV